MKFKELEKEMKDELDEELRELAKGYMKDLFMDFTKAKAKFESIERKYNEDISNEISEEFLYKKGYIVKRTRDY